MAITAIGLCNFRGYRRASIALKPLTVLLGPNSAGKSSFGHALAAMGHAQWIHGGTVQATLSPRDANAAEQWPIDLGQYADLRSEGSTDRVYIELTTDYGPIEFGFGRVELANDLRLSYVRLPYGPASTAGAPLSHQEGTATGTAPIENATTTHSSEVKAEPVARGVELLRRNPNEWFDAEGRVVRPGLDGLFVETLRHDTGTEMLINTVAQNAAKEFLTNLTYLRASRKRPSRGYEQIASGQSSLGYAGERAAVVLSERAQAEIEYLNPPALPDDASEAVKLLECPWDRRRVPLASAVGEWLKHLGLACAIETRESRLYPGRIEIRVTLGEGRPARDITEIGYGISQVLPVLVGGLLTSDRGAFIIDLPEGHLHPRPQSALADFFCSLALCGRTSLVETHSEMFFHRLRLRASQNRELLDKIAVYFFDEASPEGGCADPRLIGLDFKDELKWPKGFLQEGWEMEEQISAFREARKAAQK